jgi:hypothetical protein
VAVDSRIAQVAVFRGTFRDKGCLLPGPDFELNRKLVYRIRQIVVRGGGSHGCKLTRESQDPVHRLMPSLLTPRQLTRFSWPFNDPTFSPRSVSHTCDTQVRFWCLPLASHAALCVNGVSNIPCIQNRHSRQTVSVQKRKMQPT